MSAFSLKTIFALGLEKRKQEAGGESETEQAEHGFEGSDKVRGETARIHASVADGGDGVNAKEKGAGEGSDAGIHAFSGEIVNSDGQINPGECQIDE
jgi:hypothetical protein